MTEPAGPSGRGALGRDVRAGGASPYVGFVGVSTQGSSILAVFPAWAEALNLPTRTLVGHNIPLDAPAERYRAAVRWIANDPNNLGALITTHKMAVYAAARDLFDELDELAVTFGEVSSVAKRGGRLVGAARDPVTAQLALEEFLSAGHFAKTGGAALILGTGGAGTALSYALGRRDDVPSEIVCTALSARPLDHARAVHERAGLDRRRFRYVPTGGVADVDALLASLPPDSLVVNATGMGKDRPGSPVGNAARFPDRGVVWEFNYRGSLEFLQQARRQQEERRLVVEDGWRYFVHGWSQVIADVFDIAVTPEVVARLGVVAAEVRT